MIDVAKLDVLGHIPVGWYPSEVSVTADGKKLLVTNAKGYGSGPNAGPKFTGIDPFVGRLMNGTLDVIDLPVDSKLDEGTQQVLKNNGFIPVAEEKKQEPVPHATGAPSKDIRYVVFITKENRTFDEMLGDMKYTNGQTLDGYPNSRATGWTRRSRARGRGGKRSTSR